MLVCMNATFALPRCPRVLLPQDHRNGTMLRNFLIQEYIGGPAGVDHPDISGLFIDDFW